MFEAAKAIISAVCTIDATEEERRNQAFLTALCVADTVTCFSPLETKLKIWRRNPKPVEIRYPSTVIWPALVHMKIPLFLDVDEGHLITMESRNKAEEENSVLPGMLTYDEMLAKDAEQEENCNPEIPNYRRTYLEEEALNVRQDAEYAAIIQADRVESYERWMKRETEIQEIREMNEMVHESVCFNEEQINIMDRSSEDYIPRVLTADEQVASMKRYKEEPNPYYTNSEGDYSENDDY